MHTIPEDINSLVDEAIRDHRKLKDIVSVLYHEDMGQRFHAALALGRIARRDPELMKQRWERIFRAFDDTMSCWGAVEALGEIALNMPKPFRSRIIVFLRGFRRDDCSCQGYVWSMCRICKVESERTAEFVPELEAFLDSPNICMRGQAIWALGELELGKAADRISGFRNDENRIWIYENDSVAEKSVGTIADEALKKISSGKASRNETV